jgi:Hydrolytic ATP binding site of dynein motor region
VCPQVLLRALRDFNLGKLTSDDTGIFLGLLNDLFPKTLELVPRAADTVFEAQCKKSARELRYQPDDLFALKISQTRILLSALQSAPSRDAATEAVVHGHAPILPRYLE